MAAFLRTTRECTLDDLDPGLSGALKDYFRENRLGDPSSETVACCETATEKKPLGRVAAWLEGNSDTFDRLGIILTQQWLLWARAGDRSGTITAGANLKEIKVRVYASRFPKETGLEINGYVGPHRQKVKGKLAMGEGPATRNFCARVEQAWEKANPRPKKKNIPWLNL
jgi:hypothetical protein